MDTRRYSSYPPLTLASDLTSSGTTVITTQSNDWGGNAISASLFDTNYIPCTLINDSQSLVEFILLDATTITTLATTGATIYKRGLPYTGTGNDATDETESSARKLSWAQGETKLLIGTNPPWMYAQLANRKNDETIAGLWTFENSVIPRQTSYTAPTNSAEFAPKGYVDAAALGGVNVDKVIAAGTAGETISLGNLVYFDETDNEWKLCDADTATTVNNVLLGIAQGAGVNGGAIAGGVLLSGLDENQSGMTQGDVMYAGNTAGGISNSTGTTEVTIGIARTATTLYFAPRFNQNITESQQDLIDGITASSTEINITDGLIATTAQLNEAGTFFGATDITGAEAEQLTDGSSATGKHYHGFGQGQTSRTLAAGLGTQTIAHGLGVVPKLVVIQFFLSNGSSNPVDFAHGSGSCTSISNETCTWQAGITAGADITGQTSGKIIDIKDTTSTTVSDASVSALDATNITLSWDTATGTGTVFIQWQTFA